MYEAHLRSLLSPLGIYDLEEHSASGAAVCALGTGLDTVSRRLEEIEREALTATAEGEGQPDARGHRPDDPGLRKPRPGAGDGRGTAAGDFPGGGRRAGGLRPDPKDHSGLNVRSSTTASIAILRSS